MWNGRGINNIMTENQPKKCACGLAWEHTGKHAPLPEVKTTITKVKTTIRNIGMLRQWLNEDRITDPKKMVTNDELLHWLGWDFN